MENKEKAKIIVSMVRLQLEYATNKYINARADLAKNKEGHNIWEKNHDSLDFIYNPYDINVPEKLVEQIRKEKAVKEEILQYAIEVFLDKID